MDNAYEPVWIFGWQNIGKYLGKSGKTAQRYAREGMPVFRDPGGRPMARKDLIDKYVVELNRYTYANSSGVKEAMQMICEEERDAKEYEERLIDAHRKTRSQY